MNKGEMELWARNIIQRVEEGQPVEDSLVELKAAWPDGEKIRSWARQIAGMANAARGQPILWLIGVDEQKGVVGVDFAELANLWPQIEKWFDYRAAPLWIFHLNLWMKSEKSVTALLLETDNPPYVVNTDASGGVTKEVPWRHNTGVRSANRHELLRMLVPIQRLPEIEVLKAVLQTIWVDAKIYLQLMVDLYVHLRGSGIVLPAHQCWANAHALEWPRGLDAHDAQIVFISEDGGGTPSLLLEHSDLISMRASWPYRISLDEFMGARSVNVEIGIRPSLFDRVVAKTITLNWDPAGVNVDRELRWVFPT